MRRRSGRRGWTALIGLLLLALGGGQILAAGQGLTVAIDQAASPPLTIIAPAGVRPGERPLVLIGHGFAGSRQIMYGFAYSLAHAGYATMSFDFAGHGANPQPLQTESLITNVEGAWSEATARGWATAGRVVVMGHSMGTAPALQFGQAYPETAATIAVSPVGATVTRALPRNLLLMAGRLETRFLARAEDLLEQAGGAGGDASLGTARKLAVIENVEHMTILFAPAAHREVVAWLDSVFGVQPDARRYTDLRMLWYGLGLLGILVVGAALAPLFWERSVRPLAGAASPLRRRVGALVAGALIASLALWGGGQAGLQLRSLFGILVGGYLMVWFAIAGVASLFLAGASPRRPSWRETAAGLLAFAVLWLGVGLLAERVWAPWLLIWPRLRWWPLAVFCLLPWFMAVGQTILGDSRAAHSGRWALHCLVAVGGLMAAVQLTPEIGFVMLIVAALPVLLAVHALAAGAQRASWPYAISGALVIGWMLLAIFPLQ